jgi:cytokinesis protein
MCLINHLVRGAPPKSDSEELEHGFELRVGVRMELEASGVESVINKLSMLNIQSVNGELQTYREIQEEDNRLATREYDRAILRSLKNPQDVFNGIMKNVSGTRTQETFLGIMRYLMLIKDDGDRRERHFELVQMLVRSAVMDGKDGVDRDFNSVVSRTVQQCLSKLDESHLLEQAREENKGLKSRIIKLQRDKETMTAELGERDEGLVGHLKSQLAQTEEKLKVSRGLAETGKGEMDEIRLRYQEDIELLDNDLHELYTMLLETGMLEEVVGDDDYRTALVSRLEAQFERRKTIKILEGRHKKRGGAKKRINGDSHFSEDDTDDAGEEDVEDGKVFVADKVALLADKGEEKALDSTRREKVVSGSQFMDAEDDRVRAHIESRLASEDDIVSVPSTLEIHCVTYRSRSLHHGLKAAYHEALERGISLVVQNRRSRRARVHLSLDKSLPEDMPTSQERLAYPELSQSSKVDIALSCGAHQLPPIWSPSGTRIAPQ